MVPDLPVSDKIVMRPVWRRRQRRHYHLVRLARPTDAEMHDAVLVLADPDNQTFAPALYLEAFRIMDEASVCNCRPGFRPPDAVIFDEEHVFTETQMRDLSDQWDRRKARPS